MYYYILVNALFFASSFFYQNYTAQERSSEVTYEIFNEKTYPEFKYSSRITYKKAPNHLVKVFNK